MMPRSTITKIVLWTVVLYLAVLLLAAQLAKAATPSPLIQSHLPTPTPAYCESAAEWAADPNGGPGVLAYTYVAGPLVRTMFVSPEICAALQHPGPSRAFAVATQTIYHEWVHAYFLERTDAAEGNAECVSLYFLRYALRHFWGLSAAVAQTDYEFAWINHELLGMQYPQYRGTCTFPQRDLLP